MNNVIGKTVSSLLGGVKWLREGVGVSGLGNYNSSPAAMKLCSGVGQQCYQRLRQVMLRFPFCHSKILGGEVVRQRTEKIFWDFIREHRAAVGFICEDNLSIRSFFPEHTETPRLTDFTAIDDTYLYASLVSLLVHRYAGELKQLVDLGSGSNIPSIRALLDNPEAQRLTVTSVDSDRESIAVGRENAELFGVAHCYEEVMMDMMHFLRNTPQRLDTAFVANPPYLPFPSTSTIPGSGAINGGTDGLRYIRQLLTHCYPRGTLLALQWSSLSNPAALIGLIKDHFEILHVQIHRAPFGSYTGSQELKPHLLDQYRKGKAVIKRGADGRDYFFFVGTIMRRK